MIKTDREYFLEVLEEFNKKVDKMSNHIEKCPYCNTTMIRFTKEFHKCPACDKIMDIDEL